MSYSSVSNFPIIERLIESGCVLNISSIFCTLDTFHSLSGLLKEVASENQQSPRASSISRTRNAASGSSGAAGGGGGAAGATGGGGRIGARTCGGGGGAKALRRASAPPSRSASEAPAVGTGGGIGGATGGATGGAGT